ncbi:fatty acyl-AMP ligase [Solihabitans fulvus]|uniref:Fatty acyl-AMP ligase n=1 Tax=Solihabitans fulvus TaxID=1892852 RepID=A0A5B2WP88_9PSEU|nr:AMP-binding protein [Solihabitans fulvus]KAA2252824.1 fatty acyl-AMP ligase [Solihabitans fulvus]
MASAEETLHAALDAAAGDTTLSFAGDGTEIRLDRLAEQSRATARALAAIGVRAGDRVGLLFGSEPDFLRVLLAVSRLGACACPLPLPTTGRDGYPARLRGIVETAGIRDVLVSNRMRRSKTIATALHGLRVLSADGLDSGGDTRDLEVSCDDLAIVQFTSGSTARPKGVRLSHANVLAGLRAIRSGVDLGPADRVAMWLPLFHDMGLFGTLTALLAGAHTTVWSPASFVKDPAGWLRAFADGRHTVCPLPNFGYDYLRQAVPADEVAGYDMSRWRVALNGAEPVAEDSVRSFVEHFAPAGFRPAAMFPVYGLAEATLAVTFPPLGRGPRTDWVHRSRLTDESLAVPVDSSSPAARGVVALGGPVDGIELRIADEHGVVAERERVVGEVQVRGPSVTPGYLGDGHQPFTADGWLRTGDLGYLAGGDLHITGRSKEMIIVRGANYYPEDIEGAVRADPGVHRRRCVAFADHDADGQERVTLVAETVTADEDERAGLAQRLRDKVVAVTGLDRLLVTLVGPHAIPRTSSGKVQRLAARGRFT